MSRTKKKEGAVRGKTTNRIINILLALGCLTVLFSTVYDSDHCI